MNARYAKYATKAATKAAMTAAVIATQWDLGLLVLTKRPDEKTLDELPRSQALSRWQMQIDALMPLIKRGRSSQNQPKQKEQNAARKASNIAWRKTQQAEDNSFNHELANSSERKYKRMNHAKTWATIASEMPLILLSSYLFVYIKQKKLFTKSKSENLTSMVIETNQLKIDSSSLKWKSSNSTEQYGNWYHW